MKGLKQCDDRDEQDSTTPRTDGNRRKWWELCWDQKVESRPVEDYSCYQRALMCSLACAVSSGRDPSDVIRLVRRAVSAIWGYLVP